jgi:hypothetical protein
VRIPTLGLIIAATAVLLTGCVPSGPADPTSSPTRTASPTPSPTPTATPSATPTAAPPAEITPVDPGDYATQIADIFGSGVDFDSADGNMHCGIWESRGSGSLQGVVNGPYAGCRPQTATYETDPNTTSSGEVGCRGAQLAADLAAEPVCTSGQAFVGEAPMNGPVGILSPNQSITYAGFTCTSPDAATIECVRASDGAGFTISGSAYRYF